MLLTSSVVGLHGELDPVLQVLQLFVLEGILDTEEFKLLEHLDVLLCPVLRLNLVGSQAAVLNLDFQCLILLFDSSHIFVGGL